MDIKEFAACYCVELKKDGCLDLVIPGWQFAKDLPPRTEYRSHIYENGDDRLGVCLMFDNGREWSQAKKKLTAAQSSCLRAVGQLGTHQFASRRDLSDILAAP